MLLLHQQILTVLRHGTRTRQKFSYEPPPLCELRVLPTLVSPFHIFPLIVPTLTFAPCPLNVLLTELPPRPKQNVPHNGFPTALTPQQLHLFLKHLGKDLLEAMERLALAAGTILPFTPALFSPAPSLGCSAAPSRFWGSLWCCSPGSGHPEPTLNPLSSLLARSLSCLYPSLSLHLPGQSLSFSL